MIVLDVKPWDDTTDMVEMEKGVRAITADGLLWGTSKLVPLVHGINKLQIACVVEDDKVSFGLDFFHYREAHVRCECVGLMGTGVDFMLLHLLFCICQVACAYD